MPSFSNRRSLLTSTLAALLLATGCQVGLSSLTRRVGGSPDSTTTSEGDRGMRAQTAAEDGSAPAEPSTWGKRTEEQRAHDELIKEQNLAWDRENEEAIARRLEYERTHPEELQSDPSSDRRGPARASQAPAVTQLVCPSRGRQEVCHGACVDVQSSDTNCGECDYKCESGSSCDFGTCRDPQGNPKGGSRY